MITSLDEAGDHIVAGITETACATEMETLEHLLNHFLTKSERLAFCPPAEG